MDGLELRKKGYKVGNNIDISGLGENIAGKITILRNDCLRVITENGEVTIDFNE